MPDDSVALVYVRLEPWKLLSGSHLTSVSVALMKIAVTLSLLWLICKHHTADQLCGNQRLQYT